MILIADSGSTKSDWVLLNGQAITGNFSTAGFNPFFHDEDFILPELKKQEKMLALANQIEKIFFYGAGCSSPQRNEVIKNALQKFFVNARITVNHDLSAAAFSVYEGEPCIAAIAGTGSNSCYFDGVKIYEEVPALGYILGDEGSGSYFGKILLKKFLYHQLPFSIETYLKEEYKLSKENIFESVYNKPNVNVYLASFFKVFATYKNDGFVEKIMMDGLKDFLENHICCFENYRSVKTHFVGSIGFLFEDVLRKTAEPMGISIGKVIKQPIDGLVNYHLKFKS